MRNDLGFAPGRAGPGRYATVAAGTLTPPVDEGTIKFDCVWQEAPPPTGADVDALCRWRDRLRGRGLVGHDDEHDVGYGNLSVRDAAGRVSRAAHCCSSVDLP